MPHVVPVRLGPDPDVGPKSVLDPLAEPVGRLDDQLKGSRPPLDHDPRPGDPGVCLGRRRCLKNPASFVGLRLKLTKFHRESRKITIPHKSQEGMGLKPDLGLALIIHDAIGFHVKLHSFRGPHENLRLRPVILPPQAVGPDPGEAARLLRLPVGRRIFAGLDEGAPDPRQLYTYVSEGLNPILR